MIRRKLAHAALVLTPTIMTHPLHSILLATACGFTFSTSAIAELSLPNFFSDHMVLQRDKPVAIWGIADANAEVKVSFAGKSAVTTADDAGVWKVKLPPLSANATGTVLTVTSGTDHRSLNDVLVGEVWFASGQSNMAFKVAASHQAATDIAEANHPGIRMFNADLTPAAEPQSDIGGSWAVCSPETVPKFSAVAYFFGLNLRRELDVPVGIINSSWGGKPVETFTSREALASVPEGKPQLDQLDHAMATYDPKKAEQRYQAALARYDADLEIWKQIPKAERKKQPQKPAVQRSPAATEGRPAALYNGMIHPFVGYAQRGAIWYQGEANSKTTASSTAYATLFPLMVNDWRKRWDDDFTFLWVQLANFKKPTDTPGAIDSWAELQDVQRMCLKLPKTGMAVINDIGAADDIHPKNKKEVGRRLALWALSHDYGKDIVHCGPLYRDHEIKGSAIRLRFENCKDMKSRDGGPLERFEIAGEDKVWFWANAEINGDSIIVSSSEVPKPIAVRYAWSSNPEGSNLVNGDGLPCSIFRTDE